jgi:hypothetical protein
VTIEIAAHVATGNRVLALWVVRIDIDWKLPVRIWDPYLRRRRRWASWLVRAWVEAWLPGLLRSSLSWRRGELWHGNTWRLEPLPWLLRRILSAC